MSIPSWAVRGAKVVCVNAEESSGWVEGSDPLIEGEVYTVEGAFISHVSSRTLLVLREAKRSATYNARYGREGGYRADRFRPVVELKTDDEIEARLFHKKGLHQSTPRRKAVDA